MKKYLLLNIIFSSLIFAVSICMFMQASSQGSMIFLDSGLGFEPKDLGLALLMLTLLILPLWLTALFDFKKNTHYFKYSFIACLLVLYFFPISFEARLWSQASFPDGKPIFDDYTHERVKSWDFFFGYVPLWQSAFSINPPYDRYETTDLGTRQSYVGNSIWGVAREYGLNEKGWLVTDETEYNNKVYECIFNETHHLFGFYWRNSKLSEMKYWTEDKLPKDKCQQIQRPKIGSELTS